MKKRLDNVVASGHRVIVGDANGADKAVQKHFHEIHYDKVTVFCSGATPRNNLGTWLTHHVDAPKHAKGFQFYAAKDREMAREADFGLMIWDGKSPGTVLNVLRLAIAGKIAVLFNVPDKDVVNIKSVEAWRNFIAHCSDELRRHVRERATPDEWRLVETSDQPTFLSAREPARSAQKAEEASGETCTSSPPQGPALDEVRLLRMCFVSPGRSRICLGQWEAAVLNRSRSKSSLLKPLHGLFEITFGLIAEPLCDKLD